MEKSILYPYFAGGASRLSLRKARFFLSLLNRTKSLKDNGLNPLSKSTHVQPNKFEVKEICMMGASVVFLDLMLKLSVTGDTAKYLD